MLQNGFIDKLADLTLKDMQLGITEFQEVYLSLWEGIYHCSDQ